MMEFCLLQRMVARVDLVLSFLLFCYAAFAQNPDADPWQIAFNSTASIGPDGESHPVHREEYS